MADHLNPHDGDPLAQSPSHMKSSSMSTGNTNTNESLTEQGDPTEQEPMNEKESLDDDVMSSVQNPPTQQGRSQPSINPATAKQVDTVLNSELGVATLLSRLKQSITSAKEFATFLRKRSGLEDDHAQSLRKLCRLSQESMRRPEHRQGSFGQAYDEMMQLHERMAESGAQFAMSLHQMHDDLLELAGMADRSRKSWKTNGLAAEQKVADLDQGMRKSKAKYDSLAEEYERARTGEPQQGGKVFKVLKGTKSPAQHEEDLLKKVQAADAIYYGHVQTLQGEKSTLISSTRPEAIRALQDLVKEMDSGLALQMQKFAAFNERLLMSNGMIVSPFKLAGSESAPSFRGLKQTVAAIDNDRDLHNFVSSQHAKVQPNFEIKYERNPVLNPQPSSYNQSQPPFIQAPQQSTGQGPPQQGQLPPGFMAGSLPSSVGRQGTGGFSTPDSPQPPPGPPPPNDQGLSGPGGPESRPFAQQQQQQPHNRSFSQGNMMSQAGGPPAAHQQQQYSRNSTQPAARYGNNGGPPNMQGGAPQLGALPFQGGPRDSPQPGPSYPSSSQEKSGPPGPGPAYGAAPPPYGSGGRGPEPVPSAPTKPVFGVPLNRLYERDGLAVPMVVYQCVQALDLFGLQVEGIYRQSGSLAHINKLKSMFDTDSQNPALDFRNPENFYHDVNSVSGLLKQFFRDLPDPLLTMEHHGSLITAGKQEDDIVRRDSLHAIINSLPDPNYATLRALALHLHRVMDKSNINRMPSHNLAVIFGPTLMGSDPSTAMADAGWQIKVIDTILQNTYQIFDED